MKGKLAVLATGTSATVMLTGFAAPSTASVVSRASDLCSDLGASSAERSCDGKDPGRVGTTLGENCAATNVGRTPYIKDREFDSRRHLVVAKYVSSECGSAWTALLIKWPKNADGTLDCGTRPDGQKFHCKFTIYAKRPQQGNYQASMATTIGEPYTYQNPVFGEQLFQHSAMVDARGARTEHGVIVKWYKKRKLRSATLVADEWSPDSQPNAWP